MLDIPKLDDKLPVFALVNGVYAVLFRNPMIFVRAGLFPFLLLLAINLWHTPQSWGQEAFYGIRVIEWLMILALWTFYAVQLQRFVLKGSFEGATSFLPKLNLREWRFFKASVLVLMPLTIFAFWFDQPLFFHQPDVLVMGGITALDGVSLHLYASLFLGWIMQVFAFVLPAIAEDNPRPARDLFAMSFNALRQDFTRLFAASVLVALPLWVAVFILRLVLHMPIFTQLAMGDEASALVWNLLFLTLETAKTFIGGGLLAMLWALAYGRTRGRHVDSR